MARPCIAVTGKIEEMSFNINLPYVRSLEMAGAASLGIPHQSIEAALEVLERCDGLLLAGGADVDPVYYGEEVSVANGTIHPERDVLEFELTRFALSRGMPILATCRGHQVLNVALGGSLYQDVASETKSTLQHNQKAPPWYATHRVRVEKGTRLYDVFQEVDVRVNTFHHQGVKMLGNGLVATAHASDGLIEAIELPGHPFVVGVQWHPERMAERDPLQRRLFEAFVRAARRRG